MNFREVWSVLELYIVQIPAPFRFINASMHVHIIQFPDDLYAQLLPGWQQLWR